MLLCCFVSSLSLCLAGENEPVSVAALLNGVSARQVVSSSYQVLVSTIVESRDVFAIGVSGEAIFKTRVWGNADEAFGISQGLLIFSRGEQLYVADLNVGEERPVLRGYRAAAAAWQPHSRALAVSFRSEKSMGLLWCAVDQDFARVLVETGVAEGAVQWSEDGATVFFWGADEISDRHPSFLAAYDVAQGAEERVFVHKRDRAYVEAADESGLRAALRGASPEGQSHMRLTVRSAGDAEQSDPSSLVALRRLSNDLLLLAREEGGHELFIWSPLMPSVVTRLGAASAGLTRTPRAEAVDRYEATAQLAASVVDNDEISGATLVTSLPYFVSQDTTFATTNTVSDPKDCRYGGHSVWYRLTPGFTGIVRVSTFDSVYDTVLSAYEGSTSLGASVGCNDDVNSLQSEIAFPVTNGHSYLIEISSFGGGAGGQLTLTIAANAGLAQMINPAPGSFLQGSRVNFSWSAAPAATGYKLTVGTSLGANDIFDGPTALSQSASVAIPPTGNTVYVRLRTNLRCSPCAGVSTPAQFIDYAYVADNVNAGAITFPDPGSTLVGGNFYFVWAAGTNVSAYALSIGNYPGGNDIYSGSWVSGSYQYISVPTDGRTIYVRLWSLLGLTTHYSDYTYVTYNAGSARSAMSTPAPASALTGSSVTFTWTAGTNVTGNTLAIGNALGGNDVFNGAVSGTSTTVSGLPIDARTLFVRLCSTIYGNPQCEDYTYTAYTGTRTPVSISSPVLGTRLPSTVPFTWNVGGNVAWYRLLVGTSAGSGDIYRYGGPSSTSAIVTGIPTDGSTVYVRLYSLIYNGWVYNDYTYTTQSQGSRATMISPAPNAVLYDNAATFTWTTVAAASGYWLDVGTTTGQGNLCASGAITSTSYTCSAIPLAGDAIYVRLWTQLAGVWQYYDYRYSTPVPATLASPTPGSTLGGSSATFYWGAGTGASAYWLDVGTAQGQGNIFGLNVGVVTSWAVPGIPTDGSAIYVRLWTLFTGPLGWQHKDYVYTAATLPSRAVIVTPAPGSALAGSSVRFAWTTIGGATGYWLDVGTSLGTGNRCASGVITVATFACSAVPTDGTTVYVRLWTQITGTWRRNDYTYVAANFAKAVMVAPQPGTALPGGTVTFTWTPGTGAAAYWLDVGTSAGVGNIYGANVGSNTSWTVGGVPINGVPVYVRLWSSLDGKWVYNDYVYSAAVFQKAVLISPTPGTTLGPAAVFTWAGGLGATAYWLDVGTVYGQGDIFAGNVGTVTSYTVSGIPRTGGSVYVRLWSRLGGTWFSNDYLYAAPTQ